MPEAASRKPTFLQWIRQCGVTLRRDALGSDLGRYARWIAQDPCFPARCRTVDTAVWHLREHPTFPGPDLPDEIGMRSLFVRYREFLAAGGVLTKAEPRKTVHRGYLIPEATETQILEISRLRAKRTGRRVTLGDVIAVEIAKAHRRERRLAEL